MKKLIKQDILILLSLIAAYHPEAEKSIEREAQKLTMQGTRDYLLLLQDGASRICPYADAFISDSPDNLFWLGPPRDAASVRALHLHVTRVARNSPEGSVVMPGHAELSDTIGRVSRLPEQQRREVISVETRQSLTRARLCSTVEFIKWLKGGDEVWR